MKSFLLFIVSYGFVSAQLLSSGGVPSVPAGGVCYRDRDCFGYQVCQVPVSRCSNPLIQDCQKRCVPIDPCGTGRIERINR
jgi:hypothetical protein